jgi:hypothetical protein
MRVWRVGVIGVAVWCGFPLGEDEDGCAGGVGRRGVGIGDGVFHSPAHAFVAIFLVSDVGAVPFVWGFAAVG